LSITRRFIYLLSLGLPFLILAAIFNTSFAIFIIYNLICATLLLVDFFISISENELTLVRTGNDNLSIYEKEAICFQIYNKSNYKLYLELKDEVPEYHFQTENKLMKGTISPHEKKVFQYFVIPTKRGAFTFKNLHYKYVGRLKLCMKVYVVKLDREYKVYPNLKNLGKYRLGICNNRMFKQGQRNLRILGKGTAFESLRSYVVGDEYKKINWKATSRENKLIVNQYEPEKNQHVYMFIDTGRPMSYTVRGYRKLDLVVNTALVLSDVVNQNGDKSALLIFNTEVTDMIMPGKGPAHRGKILEALYHIDYSNETSNYDDSFYHYKMKERHRSIIFLFTDFDTIEETENMLKVLPVLSKNNMVVILLIKNESLEDISKSNIAKVEDLFDKGVALELLEDRQKIINLLNRKGILCIECATEKLELNVINKYIQLKNQTYL